MPAVSPLLYAAAGKVWIPKLLQRQHSCVTLGNELFKFPKMKHVFLAAVLILSCSAVSLAQTDKVFLLGSEEQRYEQLTSGYSQTLLEATGGDITQAFEGWLDMQQAIDAYALTQNYDLNGVRLWLHVFWAPNGDIDQIGFLLRPDSRLVEENEIKALLAGFIGQYRLPVQSSQKFNHYTGATFPTLSQRKGQ